MSIIVLSIIVLFFLVAFNVVENSDKTHKIIFDILIFTPMLSLFCYFISYRLFIEIKARKLNEIFRKGEYNTLYNRLKDLLNLESKWVNNYYCMSLCFIGKPEVFLEVYDKNSNVDDYLEVYKLFVYFLTNKPIDATIFTKCYSINPRNEVIKLIKCIENINSGNYNKEDCYLISNNINPFFNMVDCFATIQIKRHFNEDIDDDNENLKNLMKKLNYENIINI